MKRINILGTNNKDVHYSTDEPNLPCVENSSHGKAHLVFFKLIQRFETKIMPPKTPHGMSGYLDPTLI